MVARSGSAGRGKTRLSPRCPQPPSHLPATTDSHNDRRSVIMAVDMFLKLEGVKGESKDHKHGGEIHIESFSWGMNQTGAHATGGGGGAGKVHVHDISFTKFVDKSSPTLMLFCAGGKHIPNG